MTGMASVDEYLANVTSNAARNSLIRLREIIFEEVPQVEEKISYGIPTYRYKGHIASIAAFKKHLSFFPGHTVRDFTNDLKEFKTSKGTVQFTPDKPIPENLVREMLQARLKENIESG